jgi:hypothetical protein
LFVAIGIGIWAFVRVRALQATPLHSHIAVHCRSHSGNSLILQILIQTNADIAANPANPLIGTIGVQTKSRHICHSAEPLAQALWNVLFYKYAAFGDKYRKNLPARQQFFLKKAVHQRNLVSVPIKALYNSRRANPDRRRRNWQGE